MSERPYPATGIVQALAAALLFGASVPVAKALLSHLSPVMLAGLLYLGAGLGLTLWRTLVRTHEARLSRRDLPALVGAIVSGGIAAPLLLLFGLAATPAANASLLLNLEGVFTTLLAWFLFKENVDARVALGAAAIVVAGALLSWSGFEATGIAGPLAIALACVGWAIDNNLTRRIAGADPVAIAGIKGLAAGTVNLALAVALGVAFPGWGTLAAAGVAGLLGYGVSLVLFVLALRHLGTARTGAYFGVAPFFGAALALLAFGGQPGPLFWAASALMAMGVWLHVSERHVHWHVHEPLVHAHAHVHDAHHRHAHDFPWNGREPHSHVHEHEPAAHAHPHYPDLHHRHRH